MTKSKRPLTTEERELFRDTLKGTAPLKAKRRQPTSTPVVQRKRATPAAKQTADFFSIDQIPAENLVSSTDTMHFARSGLQHRLILRLQRGQIPIEASLDLHRLSVSQAIATTQQFIAQCHRHNIRLALIIHGKGHYSNQGKPLIKNALQHWLREQASVLAFHSAQPRHGGVGAVYVLLKNQAKGSMYYEE